MGSIAYATLEDRSFSATPGSSREDSYLLGKLVDPLDPSSTRSSFPNLLSYFIHKLQVAASRRKESNNNCRPPVRTRQASRRISSRKDTKEEEEQPPIRSSASSDANTALSLRLARSLERNHRHLVDIDSSCRYSREVGSIQGGVVVANSNSNNLAAHQLNVRSSPIDLQLRYQPDPTSNNNASSSSSAKPLPPKKHPPSTQTTTPNTASSSKRMSLRSNASSNSGNIISKPSRGWLHPDILFVQDGINFAVQYIGSLRVNTSMKVLDFNTRSAIAKECINRICEAAGRPIGSDAQPRVVDPKVSAMLEAVPNLERSGSSVQLTVTSLWLKLSDYDSGQAVLTHIMPNISFASGGDADTANYVAYVAKDKTHGGTRSCYVIECTGGRAQEVITTIGQAFELRFKEYLKRVPSNGGGNSKHSKATTPAPSANARSVDDVEYYNDLPGKKPPVNPQEPSSAATTSANNNLIDFSTEISPSSQRAIEPEYMNGDVVLAAREEKSKASDPFDMSPFPALPSPVLPQPSPVGSAVAQLASEPWFHGAISRKDSEVLLQKDGDFLVRESLGSPGQYVLTGMQCSSKKHLLLVDPAGIVRTKDRSFDSVSHLVNHHLDNGLPIISAESTLRLLFPVRRKI